MGKREAKTISKGQSQARTPARRRTLERCTTKGKTKNVVLIDVDNGKAPEVVIIDFPESSTSRVRVSKLSPKKVPAGKFISIDDDEINVEEPSENGDGSGDGQQSDGTSSKASCPAFSQSRNSEESDGDDCQIIRERKFPLSFSKSKRTYSQQTFSRNRFGFSQSSSESDSSDCEFMEGPSGKLCQQWERAAMKKKMFDDVQDGQPSSSDQVSASESFGDFSKDVKGDNTSSQHVEEPFCSTSKNVNDGKLNPSTSRNSGNGIWGDRFTKGVKDDPVAGIGKTVKEDASFSCKPSVPEEEQVSHMKDEGKTSMGEPTFSDIDIRCDTYHNHGKPSHQATEERIPEGPSRSNCQEAEQEHFDDKTSSEDKEENVHAESYWFNYKFRHESHLDLGKASLPDEEVQVQNSSKSNGTYVNHDRFVPQDNNEEIYQNSTSSHTESPNSRNYGRANSEFENKAVSCKPSLESNQPIAGGQVNDGVDFMEEEEPIWEESLGCKTQTVNEITRETFNFQVREVSHSGEPSLSNAQVNHLTPCFSDAHNLVHARDDIATHDIQNDIIGEREKYKETAEFKRAAEEEWAARQHQLQIQAEEVQRLRKRKRAEALRLVDMERRQKERVEEMRETQKKNVETINLKEQLRAEVRKELCILELLHTNMASLLRGLGIHVAGGFCPSSREIHGAYKQALLRFHPDRASRTDIRQQVEAEEKFKLISRLKEKLLPTS